MKQFNLFIVFALLLCGFTSLAQQPDVITDTNSVASVGRYAYYFEDKTIGLQIEKILLPEYQSRFQPAKTDAPNLKVTKHALWARITIRNQTAGAIYLNIGNPILDTVSFYQFDRNGQVSLIHSGLYVNASMRPYNTSNLLFKLGVSPGDTATYFIRATANSPLQMPLYAGGLNGFIRDFSDNDIFNGCYYGVVIIMILYNLFLFFSIRDRLYLYYILYAFFIGVFNANLNGHLYFFYDGALQNWLSRRIITESCIVLFAMTFFSVRFLNLKANAPKLYIVTIISALFLLVPITMELSGDVWTSDDVAHVFAEILSFCLLVAGIYVYYKGYKPARFYVIAWIAFLFSVIIFTLAIQDVIPYNGITRKSMELGSALEMVLISLALADRINIYKSERAKAQSQLLLASRENERLVTDQNIILEQKVTERTHELAVEKKKSDDLLLNILPGEVATELKEKGKADARLFDNVTVLFTDFVGFTKISERLSPQKLVDELDACFKVFDGIMEKYNIEKIKTVGDAYLAVSGLPVHDTNHAGNVVGAAIEIMSFMQQRKADLGDKTFEIRIGIHSGSVVAGIVGVKKFAYDIWGDTVNTAARMEQNSEPGKINISEVTYEIVKDKFTCVYRGEVDAKGKGMLKMYYVKNTQET